MSDTPHKSGRYKRATKEEIVIRRQLVAEFMMKGLIWPSEILKQFNNSKDESMRNMFGRYRNPPNEVKRDILHVQESYKLIPNKFSVEEVKGELISKLELLKKQQWSLYQKIDDIDYEGKLKVADKIQELDEKIAFYKGVDPNTAVPKTVDINMNQNTNMEGNKDLGEGLSKLEKGLKEFGDYFDLDNIKNTSPHKKEE